VFVALLLVGLLPLGSFAAEAGDGPDVDLGSALSISPNGLWLPNPSGPSFGLEIITEGTNFYPLPTRQVEGPFPRDYDFTILGIFGFTGDKLTIKINDEGDLGDRLVAVALAQYASFVQPFWGTMYSSDQQNAFEISIPQSQPGSIVYLISGFFGQSTGADPFTYTITVSFPR
jgi:hypothetical protein